MRNAFGAFLCVYSIYVVTASSICALKASVIINYEKQQMRDCDLVVRE